MSMLSAWTMGAMASKKASASAPVSAADRLGQGGRGQRAGGDDPLARRPAGTRPPPRRCESGDALRRRGGDGARRRARGPPPARRRPAAGAGRPSSMISPPAARISQCSRPTAFCSSSSERNEFEQTISARSPVLCAKVPTLGRISWMTTGTPASRRLPGGLGAGHAAADDMKGVCHAAGVSPPRHVLEGAAVRDAVRRRRDPVAARPLGHPACPRVPALTLPVLPSRRAASAIRARSRVAVSRTAVRLCRLLGGRSS